MLLWVHLAFSAPALSAGQGHTCAVEAGSLWCWGGMTAAQAKAGLGSSRPTPQRIEGHWRAVAAGGRGLTCAIDHDGGVWCWGLDEVPKAVGVSADEVTVGLAHACARTGERAVCWGNNRYGQLGQGAVGDESGPVAVVIDRVRSIDAGDLHTCAVRTDGTVWCWGANEQGQLGLGSMSSASPKPTPVLWLQDAAQVSAGGFFTCVRRTGGSAVCFGDNLDGQLGDNRRTASGSPVAVLGANDLVDLACGFSHACAARRDGRLWCWGASQVGQIGSDETIDHLLPGLVREVADAVAVEAGQQHTCVQRGQDWWCMGDNFASQLGDGGRTGGHTLRQASVGR
jgi:alpha-tubulin suppressor-like RCC1 family protein